MSIISLRQQQNALAARLVAIKQAVDDVLDLQIVYTETLAKAADGLWDGCWSGCEDDDAMNYQDMVGKTMRIISFDFLFPLIRNEVDARNLVSELDNIRRLASKPPAVIALADGPEPVSDGWLPDEIEMVKRCYRNRIAKTATDLRNINTNWKYLDRLKRPIPDFIQSSLLGMFGRADLMPWTYSEADFKDSHRVTPPKVMTAYWLAPFIGVTAAQTIEGAMNTIAQHSAPRPGEPPTLDFFSSKTSNAWSPI